MNRKLRLGLLIGISMLVVGLLVLLPSRVSITGSGALSLSNSVYAHPSAPVVANWTVNDSGGATTNTITLTKPSGVVSDNLLLLIVGSDQDTVADWNDVTGWTKFININDGVSDANLACYWRIADESEASTIDVTGPSVEERYGWYIRVTGADTTTPVHLIGTPTYIAASSYTIAEVTTTADDCLVFYGSAHDGGDAGSFTESGVGWAEVDEQYSGTAGTDACGVWGTKTMTGQGGTVDVGITKDVTDGTSSIQFAIQPSTGATPNIGNLPTSKGFGTVDTSTDYWSNDSAPTWPLDDIECYFTVTNNSGAAVDITVKGTNFTGGVGWTLAGTPAENTVTMKAGKSGDALEANMVTLTTSELSFIAGLPDTNSKKWELKLETATSHTDGVEKTGTVTLTATLS